jgi:hypothetical protein
MCVMSMVMDHYQDKWGRYAPNPTVAPNIFPYPIPAPATVGITPEEIAEFKKLLDRAREYDRTHNQPDCELDSKKENLKNLAKDLGVEIEFV